MVCTKIYIHQSCRQIVAPEFHLDPVKDAPERRFVYNCNMLLFINSGEYRNIERSEQNSTTVLRPFKEKRYCCEDCYKVRT